METNDKNISANPLPEENSNSAATIPTISTDELNPNNVYKVSNASKEVSSAFGSLFGGGGFQDYKPLFDKYSEIFNQQDTNCNYLKKCIDILNMQLGKARRAAWLAILIAIAALIISIIK